MQGRGAETQNDFPALFLMQANPAQLLARDNIDDRREVFRLLSRLPPLERVKFDAWCCRRAALPGFATVPVVLPKTWNLARQARWDTGADERLTWEIWFDLWVLAKDYAFDLDVALGKLVGMVR